MRLLTPGECISPAIDRTKDLLFRPFNWRTFLKITAVAFFAEIGYAFSSGFGGNNSNTTGGGNLPIPQATIVALLFGIALVFLVIGLIMLYVGSRLQLVLLEVVITRQTFISPMWRRYSSLTWRWVGLKVLFFIGLALLLLFILLPFIPGFIRNIPPAGQPPSARFLSHIFLLIFLVFFVVILVGAAYCLLRDFVLPFIAIENLPLSEALRRLSDLVSEAPGEITMYLVVRLVVSLGAGIGAEIFAFLVLLVSAVPFVLIGGILWLALRHSGSAGNAALIAAAIVGGLIFLVWAICVGIGIVGTVFVFLQAFALYFLGGRYPNLGAIFEPAPPPSYYPAPQFIPPPDIPPAPAI
jgi:hypothetical protein